MHPKKMTKEEKMSKKEELEQTFSHRKVAQIVLEAITPLKVGSGESDVTIDASVLKNWNGLPMIQGSSLAGVLRASFDDEDMKKHLFGEKFGSRVLLSHAHLLDKDGKILYELGRSDDSDFLNYYDDLPVREHTAITDKGVAYKSSKFDEEVVYKGSRFKFELELITDNSKEDKKLWEELLSKLVSPLFRVGSGSTKGFGEMNVVSCHTRDYVIGVDYHDKPSDLNKARGEDKKPTSTLKALTYKIAIQPADFFSFGAGFGDDEVDAVAAKEKIVTWDASNKGKFSDEMILLPASSLKGALSHRVAFHYNKIKKRFADEIPLNEFVKHIGSCNHAVATLFGAAKGHQKEAKGKALFSDVFSKDKHLEKIFDHVKIDRFTGGAMDSALYNEKVIAQDYIWHIKIVLSSEVDADVKKAFEATLDDLCRGWLPLGGMVNRGHGVFEGVPASKGGYDKVDDSHENGWISVKGGNDE